MIMLGSDRKNEYGRLLEMPDDTGGRLTQACYVIAPDADAQYQPAKAA